MTPEAAVTLGVLVLVLVGLALEVLSADILLLAGLGVLMALDVVSLEVALRGFANPTLLAIGSLFVVAEGLRRSGALRRAAEVLLGRSQSLRVVLLRLTGTSAVSSAFLNNTPVVAMGIPTVLAWAEERDGISPSKLLIPLSYASIFGGVCTLIGTSTNLVADGLLRAEGQEGLGFFELSMVGIPLAVLGIAALVTVVPALLPERAALHSQRKETGIMTWARGAADYLYRIPPGSGLVGRSVGEAGLATGELKLVRVSKESSLVAPVGEDERLHEGDHLVFRGASEAMERTARQWGLDRAGPAYRLEGPFQLREAVIPEGSPLVGETVGETDFPDRYGALVTGVFRGARAVRRDPAGIRLRAGDTLLLETTRGFARAHASSPDFYLVGGDEEEHHPSARFWQPTRAKWGAAVLAAVIVLSVFEVVHISVAALGGAVTMIATGFLSPGEARRSVDWSVLLVIGAALGIGSAMEVSGAAELLGRGLLAAGEPLGAVGVLAALLFGCSLLTAVITNNAAVALLFPIALSVSESLGADPRPFVVAVTVAASLSFATPLGYQTNLMVYGPGGYRFTDFMKAGIPLQILTGVVAVLLIPLIWPF